MGEVFAGRYELVDLLGRGGMGDVWRAWDRRARGYVCAKVLRQSDAASLIRFVREQTLRIAHPHVVAPKSWAAEDERVLFTMDLVRGGSVGTLVGDHGPLPSPYVACLVDQLLHALEAVHGAGVIHRDLKPANLLLEPTGRAFPHLRLSDFGIAVKQGEPRLTSTDLVIGTPGYLAPEQLRGADPEPRQDLYAAGVAGIEMLTGERPGADGSWTSSCPVAVNPALWELLRTLVAERPERRPASADAARAQLTQAGVLPASDAVLSSADEPVDVLEQVPPLPGGWGPSGPIGAPVGPGRPEPGPRSVPLRPVPPPPGSSPPGPSPSPPSQPRSTEVSPSSSEPSPESNRSSPSSGKGLLVARVALAVVAVAALAVAGWAGLTQWMSDGAEEPGGSSSSGTEVSPASGTDCSFENVGTQEPAEEGDDVECVFGDGEYQWELIDD